MKPTVDDVAKQLGREITDPLEIDQIKTWIDIADLIVRKRYPNLDQLVKDGVINAESVKLVEALAVARYSRNPEGTTSNSTRIDDYQETYGTTNAKATMEILDDEWDLLAPSDTGSEGAFTITPKGWQDYEPRSPFGAW
jgi:DNA-binding PadR family transcriptional regulator